MTIPYSRIRTYRYRSLRWLRWAMTLLAWAPVVFLAASALDNFARDRMPDALAYTTVLSTLRTMEEKGYVRHVEEGRAHRYLPRVQQGTAHRGAIARLVDTVFGGSPGLALTQLVSDRRISDDELRRIRDLIDERLPEREP